MMTSVSDTWLQLVARRLCGYRSADDWRAEAQRVSLQRRQQITERAVDVQAARELLTLIECPTAADLRREEARVSEDVSDEDGRDSPAPPLVLPVTASAVERFNALLNEDVTVEQLRSFQHHTSRDPLHDAVSRALTDSSAYLIIDWRSDDSEIFQSFRKMEERLHLTAAMDELERRVRAEYEAATVEHGSEGGAGFWADWHDHVIAAAVSECERLGVRVLDCTGGDTSELLLTRAEHFDRVLGLIEQLGLQDMRPFTAEERCLVCAAARDGRD